MKRLQVALLPVLLAVIFFCSEVAHAEPLASYNRDKIAISAVARAGALEITSDVTGISKVEVSEVPDPPRIVIDLLGVRSPSAKTFTLAENGFVRSIRLGAHPDKVRVVIDLTGTEIKKFTRIKRSSGITIVFGEARPVEATPSPTPELTQSRPAEVASPIPSTRPSAMKTEAPPVTSTSTTSTVTTTSTVAPPLPTATEAQTRELPTTTINQPASLVATPEPTKEAEILPPPGEFLISSVSFDYLPPAFNPVVRLPIVGGIPTFKLLRTNDRTYTLVIPKTRLKKSNLTLPHYPPQDFTGFTVIQPRQKGRDVEITVGVSRGYQILAVYQGDGIILRIKNG